MDGVLFKASTSLDTPKLIVECRASACSALEAAAEEEERLPH
jgi:hypothetical protein